MLRLSSVFLLPSALVMTMSLVAVPAFAQDDEGDIQFAPNDDEPAPPPSPPVAPTDAVQGPERPVQDPEADGNVQIHVRGKAPDRVFGTYRVRVSYNRPEFNDGMRFYNETYGKPSAYPTFTADWFAWDWYATLGLKFGMGYYTDDGHALKTKEGVTKAKADLEPTDLEQDKNGKTSLTLIPLQVSLAAEMTPFAKKWLVLDGWIGVERIYWQEVRTGGGGSSTSPAAVMEDPTATDSKDSTLTNKGWKNGTVIGASANILLNPLDEQGAASMRGSMGLGYIYLSPFMEIARSTNKDGVSFGRKVYGVGFTFETVK